MARRTKRFKVMGPFPNASQARKAGPKIGRRKIFRWGRRHKRFYASLYRGKR